jgi:hypothetical protein
MSDRSATEEAGNNSRKGKQMDVRVDLRHDGVVHVEEHMKTLYK